MRSVPTNTLAVLQNAPRDGIKVRDFVWIENVGGTEAWGFYSGIDPAISLPVISPLTGTTQERTYYGAGTLQSVSDITLTTGLDVYRVTVTLSNINATVVNAIRGNNVRNARVEIHRGIINPLTDQLADPPIAHFVGTINQTNPKTPAIGGAGGIEVICTSITNELTRSNPSLFSDATIRRRGGDRFCRYMEVMADVKLPWGADPQTVSKPPKRKKFLGLF
jgi:hypothetical protein